MAKTKTTSAKSSAKSSKGAKAAKAPEMNAATELLHTLFGGLATAIDKDPKIASLAQSYGITLDGAASSEGDDEEEFEEDEDEDEEEEEAPKSKKGAKAAAKPAAKAKKKKALTADDVIEVLDGDDADAANDMFDSLEDEELIREIAVTRKLVKAKQAAKTDADTLIEMIGEHFGLGEEEGDDEEEEGIDPDDMSEEELLAFVLENKLATKAKAKKLDEDELRALVAESLEEEEEEDEDEEEEEDEFDEDEEEDEEDEDEDDFDDEFDDE